jgi:hypothetical protein
VPGPLVPYHENAMRNRYFYPQRSLPASLVILKFPACRMPVKFPNEAIKGARFCAPRNVSTITYAR